MTSLTTILSSISIKPVWLLYIYIYIYISLASIKNLIDHNLSQYSLHFYKLMLSHTITLSHSLPTSTCLTLILLTICLSCQPPALLLNQLFPFSLPVNYMLNFTTVSFLLTLSTSHTQITKGNDKFDETFPSLIG